MWSSEVTNMIITGIWETLYMTLVSTLVGYVIGLPMGINPYGIRQRRD